MTSLDKIRELRDNVAIATDEYRRAIVEAHADGYSLREIAAAVGVTHQTIANMITRTKHDPA